MHRILWVALWLMTASGMAQTVSLNTWPNGTVDLSGSAADGNLIHGWRVQDGDNPAWAEQEYDDSSWPVMPLADGVAHSGKWRWYRLRLRLPASSSPLALLIDGRDGAYELYVNGERVEGPRLKPSVLITNPKEREIVLPATGDNVELALRVSVPSPLFRRVPTLVWIHLGTAPAIESERREAEDARTLLATPGLAANLLLLISSIGVLLLYRVQQSRREYLWLGFYLVGTAINTACFHLYNGAFVPVSVNWLFAIPLLYVSTVLQIEFVFSFAGRRVSRIWRAYECLLLAIPFVLPAMVWAGQLGYGPYNVAEACAIVPASLILPVLLLAWYLRGNREAGWLILPTLLMTSTVAIYDVGTVALYFGWDGLAKLTDPLPVGRVVIQSFDLADLLFLLAIGIVMFFRFTRVSREQANSAAELNAAREMQRQLVPVALPSVAGIRLEAAYLPAQEVGGDFYQVMEQEDGCSLIVVGDVSGKGLRAAMTGALAIGSLRTLAAEGLGPGALLQRLNRQIFSTQDGGFITCLCARIAGDGSLTMANAGHLSPYRNGEEIPLDSGLPLGIAADAEYSETILLLAPGDTLTLLSDGVVEAQSAAGELFGFERTREISGQSALSIAETARSFGQEDDITVLTLSFAGAGVVHE